MVFVLYSSTIQPKAKRYLKLTRLSDIISPYLVKLVKDNKSNTALFHEIVTTFSPFHLSDTSNGIYHFIKFKDSAIKINSTCNKHSMNL